MEEMAQRHLASFSLQRERSVDSMSTEYVFVRESNSADVFITIGLHQSAKDAEYIANNYLNGISLHMEEGPYQGVSIGDKFWWCAPTSDSNNVTNLVFLRKNALFIMSSHSYEEIEELAKKIDDDIIKEESYITFRD